jgi:hypothetical protein
MYLQNPQTFNTQVILTNGILSPSNGCRQYIRRSDGHIHVDTEYENNIDTDYNHVESRPYSRTSIQGTIPRWNISVENIRDRRVKDDEVIGECVVAVYDIFERSFVKTLR